MADEFYYDPEYKVLICKVHKQAVRGLTRHLKDAHSLRLKKERQPILDQYGALVILQPKEVAQPPDNRAPFDALGAPLNGFRCTECFYISTSHIVIRRHCNVAHEWQVTRDDRTHWTAVKVQTFFGVGSKKYFVVQDRNTEPALFATMDLSHEEELADQQLLDEMKAQDTAHEEKQDIMALETEKSDKTGWWSMVKWPEHFRGRNMRRIAHAGRLPDRTDPEMRHVADLTKTMINAAVDGLDTLHDDTPNWLRTANATERVENKPMVRLQNSDSLDTYITYFQRFICYCVRVRAAQKARDESIEEDSDDTDDEDEGTSEEEDGHDDGSEDRSVASQDGLVTSQRNDIEIVDAAIIEPIPAAEIPTDTMKDSCELLRFTAEQERRLDDLARSIAVEEEEDVRIQKLLAVSESMIMQSIKGLDRFDSPMVHFAAVLGIIEDENRLRRGDEFSYMLAGFMYCVRVLFVECTLPGRTRADQTHEDIDTFLELRKKYLVVGSYSPCSLLIKMLGYGKIMSLQKTNQPSVTWTRHKTDRPDGDVLEFHGKPLPLKRFKAAISDMIDEATNLLWEELMWVTDRDKRFEIDLDTIQDDLSDSKRGASWVTNGANGLGEKKAWMINQMRQAPADKKLRDGDGTTWRMSRVREYRRVHRRVQELLLALAHLGVGPPARGEEITPIRFRNGMLQDRNFYIIDGRVVYVTRYHKSQALFGEAKVIPRFLPWKVGQLFAVYLAYVRPFTESVDDLTNGLPRSDHMWHNKNGSWNCEHLTKVLTQETTIRMGLRMTTQDYRHICIAMGREYIGATFLRDLPPGDHMPFEDDDVIGGVNDKVSAVDLGAAHGAPMALRYGVLGDIIRNLSHESIRVFGAVGESWHKLLGLDHKRPEPFVKHQRDPSYSTPAPRLQPKRSRSDLQSPFVFMPPMTLAERTQVPLGLVTPSPSCATPTLSYTPVLESTPVWSDTVSESSFGSGQTYAGQTLFGQPSYPMQSTQAPTTPSPSGILSVTTVPIHSPEEIRAGLIKVLSHPEPAFRSEQQEEAVYATLELQSPLIVVLPTGGGKTLTFTLAAELRDPGVTVVVAPFRALVGSYITRLTDSKISHIVWHHGEQRYAPIVVVSADHAASTGFLMYAGLLRKRRVLRRIVIDECHLTFTASDYRPRLNHLRHLNVLRCPMVLLTATLPPARIHELKDAMALRDCRIIRMRTARPNIRYMVQRCASRNTTDRLKQIAESWVLKEGQRGVIFCNSRDGTEDVAAALNCSFYHAQSDEKGAVLQDWLSQSKFLAATAALGTGVDYPGIIYIIHLGIPHGAIDFAQETGRGGRAGEDVDSLILIEDPMYEQLKRRQPAELSMDELAMQQFIETPGCRRLALSGYLDDEPETCEEVGGRLCDHCGGGIEDWKAGEVKSAQELQRFERRMDEVQQHCGFCWVTYGPSQSEHPSMGCHHTAGLNIEASEGLRKGWKVDRRCRDCWKCGVSQGICKSIEKKRVCQWTGVAFVLWLSWFHLPSAQDVLLEAGYQGQDLHAYQRWLGLRSRKKVQGLVVSNGMWILWRMMLLENGTGQARQVEVGLDVVSIHDSEVLDVVSIHDSEDEDNTLVEESWTVIPSPADNTHEVDVLESTDTVTTRTQQVIEWLSNRCIYCEVTGAPIDTTRHWQRSCYRLRATSDGFEYKQAAYWSDEMDRFRSGKCQYCSRDSKDCGIRVSKGIVCEYKDVVLPVLFILNRQGWVRDWIKKQGYFVGFGQIQLQRWLNEVSDMGGFNRTRAIEAFDAYTMEFSRM